MTSPLLQLRDFGVAFGGQVVLTEVTLEVPSAGMTVLVGPAGSGKSTLLRTLAGLNDAHPSLATWGTALLAGAPLQTRERSEGALEARGIGLVVQHARFFLDSVRENLVSALPNRSSLDRASQTELARTALRANGLSELLPRLDEDVASLPTSLQRRLAIVRALVDDPLLLLADEPTAGLEESDAVEVISLLSMQATQRAVLLVTHNQRLARAAGGTTVLLAGGKVQEVAPTRQFFGAPRSVHAQSFVRTGGCQAPSPSAVPAELDDEVTPLLRPLPRVPTVRSRFEGPQGFFWIWPGKLGGLPRPGIVRTVEEDLEGLHRLGVDLLVTLEETPTVDELALARVGIRGLHFPIIDMGVPTLADAEQLCTRVDMAIKASQVVALHCRAGLGRTGTMLAAQLVFDGVSARDAVDRVRRLNTRCIQSIDQAEFLSSFESYLRGDPAGVRSAPSAAPPSR
jgi:atypical dual specificity phosphatase